MVDNTKSINEIAKSSFVLALVSVCAILFSKSWDNFFFSIFNKLNEIIGEKYKKAEEITTKIISIFASFISTFTFAFLINLIIYSIFKID